MAESTLSLEWADLMNAAAEYLGYGRESDPSSPSNWSTDEEARVARQLADGYRRVLNAHDWSWQYPRTYLTAWAAVAETTVTATSSSATLTATADSFYASMIGRKVKVNALSGTDDGTLAHATGETTLTATTAIFTASSDDVGATLKFDTSEEEYTIASVTSTTIVKLTGNATSTTSNSGDTFKVYREYTISAYTSAKVVTLSATPNPTVSAKLFSVASDGGYRFPDDFGGLRGRPLFEANEGAYQPLPVRSEHQVRNLLQESTSTGRPRHCAIVPLTHDGTAGQRFDLLVYPIPDANYKLYYRYNVLPSALTSSIKYAYGGMGMSQVLKAAVLASAELDRDGKQGPMWADYQNELLRAIDSDNRRKRAESLGRITDPEFDWERSPEAASLFGRREPTLYYDGVSYG